MSDTVYVIKSRITGNLIDASTNLTIALTRCENINEQYQTDEYKVEEYHE